MTRVSLRALAGLLVVAAALVGLASAQSTDASVSELQDRTAAVERAVDASQQLALPVGTGFVIGLGIGLTGGSALVYKYWDAKLS